MRTKDILDNGFEDIKTLYKYLYMDEDHFILVSNGESKFRLYMNEDLRFELEDVDSEETFVVEFQLSALLRMTQQLKHMRSNRHPKMFRSVWQDIQETTQVTL